MFSVSLKVISAMEGNRAGQSNAGEGTASSSGVVRGGLTEKVIFLSKDSKRSG